MRHTTPLHRYPRGRSILFRLPSDKIFYRPSRCEASHQYGRHLAGDVRFAESRKDLLAESFSGIDLSRLLEGQEPSSHMRSDLFALAEVGIGCAFCVRVAQPLTTQITGVSIS